MNIHSVDLSKLNSLTKYPSIPTYHAIGDKGRLTEEVLVPFDVNDKIIVTEKVDGTNARIIVWAAFQSGMPLDIDKIIIGSREELLHAHGDLIANPALGIVETLKHIRPVRAPATLTVIFGEVYGGKTTSAGKMYSPAGKTSFRVFDAFQLPFFEVASLLEMTSEEIAGWRNHGGQRFMGEKELWALAQSINVPLTPRRGVHTDWFNDHGAQKCSLWYPDDKPFVGSSIVDAHGWLKRLSDTNTRAVIDGPGGRPEGVVIRTSDRKKIAKLRFEDYERTLRRKT